LIWLSLLRPISSRNSNRSFQLNRSGPRKKEWLVNAYRWLFHSPARDSRYAVVHHVNQQCNTLQHFTNFSIFKLNLSYLSSKKMIHEQQNEKMCTVLRSCIAKLTPSIYNALSRHFGPRTLRTRNI